ncbi:MAG TPA: hypothetical protein PL151_11645 [Phycisphaerae bacterium]|nr:hypothetical protein [Phycisphaerae bacterium]HOJ73498.1 hypothetical protein [Phycisphaerae bacterium]HOM51694.1 hypothetical protein [Phycisphaerae bacterium]HON66148.1 hypothetical protein [Phycisphaerae bacterium]HOQ86291.1 hypothetical protein [Phycisphaerae bacterium]
MSTLTFARFVLVVAPLTLTSLAAAQRQPASMNRRSIWDDTRLRQRFYDRTIDRYLHDLSQAYELTDEQQEQVRARLEALKEEQQTYSDQVRDEMSRYREELAELWRSQRLGESVDAERMQELTRRMQEHWQAAPLLNPQKMLSQIEQLLPAEQVRKGRTKWDALRAERIAEWTERFSAFRQQGGYVPGTAGDSWERFVEAFCAKFELDEAQRASAMSILRDVQARRDQYRTSHADELEAANQIDDARFRAERIEQLMQPIGSLYEELRSRLDRIPTSAQIEAARQTISTSQPASAPATATRPSDMVRVQPARPFRPNRDR